MRAATGLRMLAIATLLCASASLQAQTMKLSHVRPQGSTADTDIRALVEKLGKTTSIKIEVFPANALGDYTVVQERISVGAVAHPVSQRQMATAVHG